MRARRTFKHFKNITKCLCCQESGGQPHKVKSGGRVCGCFETAQGKNGVRKFRFEAPNHRRRQTTRPKEAANLASRRDNRTELEEEKNIYRVTSAGFEDANGMTTNETSFGRHLESWDLSSASIFASHPTAVFKLPTVSSLHRSTHSPSILCATRNTPRSKGQMLTPLSAS